MEDNHKSFQMLELMESPAFCVKDGIILYANRAALQRMVAVNTDITQLLATGEEEYAAFTKGCLYLSVTIAGASCGASVTRMNGFDVFVLEQDADQKELQAMALAATELRVPLHNVMMVADRLFPMVTATDGAAAQDQIARINKGLFQMLRVISNMSDTARYSKEPASNQEICEVQKLMGEIFRKAAEQISHADIQVRFDNLPSPIYTLVDKEKLERAVHNILSNAVKFTPKGGVILARFFRRGRKLYLTVQDNGSGIAPELRGSIYSRYLRQPGVEDGRFGIGLGLVLVRSVATLHGGTVLMEHPDDAGVRITMTMNIRQDTAGALHSPILRPDYLGGRDHCLAELSDVLPAELYKRENIN